jgi:hypothetical protein
MWTPVVALLTIYSDKYPYKITISYPYNLPNIYVMLFTLEIKSLTCSDSDSEGNFVRTNIFLYLTDAI